MWLPVTVPRPARGLQLASKAGPELGCVCVCMCVCACVEGLGVVFSALRRQGLGQGLLFNSVPLCHLEASSLITCWKQQIKNP